jgi:phage N-6-adenine-methyltransferase
VTEPKQQKYRSKQDYATPEAFIAAVKARLGIEDFVCDLAADASNAKAPHYFTEEMDALDPKSNWALAIGNQWGWLNPPFSNIKPWAEKCAATVKNSDASIAFLVPAAVGANWFRDYVWGQDARVLFLNGRLAFMPDKPKWLYPKDCMLVLYHRWNAGCDLWNWRQKQERKVA